VNEIGMLPRSVTMGHICDPMHEASEDVWCALEDDVRVELCITDLSVAVLIGERLVVVSTHNGFITGDCSTCNRRWAARTAPLYLIAACVQGLPVSMVEHPTRDERFPKENLVEPSLLENFEAEKRRRDGGSSVIDWG
jgi:hypothetical protein